MTVSQEIAVGLVALAAHIEDVRAALVEQGQPADSAPTAVLGDMIRALEPTTTPFNGTDPTISGTLIAGQTITVSNGTWGGTPPMTFEYQWYISSVPVPGQTTSSYATDPAAISVPIHARVTARNLVGSGFADSAPVMLADPGGAPDVTADSTAITSDSTLLTADYEAA